MTNRAVAPNARTLLTDVSIDKVQVLAMPFSTALAELNTFGTLLHARTLGEARSDPSAARMVAAQLPSYLGQFWQYADLEEDVDEEDWIAEQSRNDAAFDAGEFWGDDDFMTWHLEPRLTTSAWLQREPTLSQVYRRPDAGWGFGFEPTPLIDSDDRVAFERDAEELGYQVLRADGLENLYLTGPSSDARTSLLAIVEGEAS